MHGLGLRCLSDNFSITEQQACWSVLGELVSIQRTAMPAGTPSPDLTLIYLSITDGAHPASDLPVCCEAGCAFILLNRHAARVQVMCLLAYLMQHVWQL